MEGFFQKNHQLRMNENGTYLAFSAVRACVCVCACVTCRCVCASVVCVHVWCVCVCVCVCVAHTHGFFNNGFLNNELYRLYFVTCC